MTSRQTTVKAGDTGALGGSDMMEAEEAETALDMRITRAGHDRIPLARIERRSRSESDYQTRGRVENNNN